LDIGCGAGAVALELAQARRDLEVVGLDVSEENLRLAQTTAHSTGVAQRCRFVLSEFSSFADEPFDIAYANSVLQLLPGTPVTLADELSRLIKKGGTLVLIGPVECFTNQCRIALRRVLKVCRSTWLENLALSLAKGLYRSWNVEELRDRIPYLYVVPNVMDSKAFSDALAKQGFDLRTRETWPVRSWFKLRHTVTIFDKR
jgi:ubiquinone/menaquinone biosynthesis C-methylase UbiE